MPNTKTTLSSGLSLSSSGASKNDTGLSNTLSSNFDAITTGGTSLSNALTSNKETVYSDSDLFFVTDPLGNPIGATTGANSDLINKAKSGAKVYYNPKTGLTETTGSKVSIDEKTGKITVESSNPSLTSERAKQMISDMRLDTISANFKANPDYRYISADGKSSQSAKDILDAYNKVNETTGLNAVDSYGLYYQNLDMAAQSLQGSHKQQLEDGSIVNIDFTDDDMLNYFTNVQTWQAIRSGKYSNADRLVIPTQIISNTGARLLSSWDEETGTVGAEDFMDNLYNRQLESWNERQEVDPTTGSTNLDLYNALERYINGKGVTTVNGQAATVHEDYATQDLATAISLYNMLTNVDPICSFWQGAGDVIGSIFNAGETVLVKIGEAGAVMDAAIMDAGTWVGYRVKEKITGDKVDETKAWYPSKMINQWAGYKNSSSFYDNVTAVRTQGIEATQREISKYNATAASVYTIAEFIGEMAVMISVGNAFANGAVAAVGRASEALGRGAAWAASAAEGANMLTSASSMANGLYTMWQLTGDVAHAASVTLNALSTALQWSQVTASVSILAESVGEALIQNPQLVGQLLTNGEMSEEARQFALSTVVGNAFGMAVGHWGSKAIQKVGETTIGKAVSRNVNRLVWSIKTWGGDSLDAARLMFSEYDTMEEFIKNGKATKYEARMQRQMIRNIQKKFLEETNYVKILGMSTDEIAAQVADYDKAILKVLNVENALDFMSSRGVYTAAAILSDPNVAVSGSHKAWQQVGNELIEMGKAAGLEATTKGGVSLLPDSIKEYVTTKSHLDILRAYRTAIENGYDVGETLTAINKEIEHFSGVLENVSEGLSPEIISKSDEFIDANRQLWRDWTDYRVEHGLLDADQIANLRKSEQWGIEGDLYVGQLRLTESPKYVLKRTDNLRDVNALEEVGKYKFGSTQGFVDPMLTFQMSVMDSAQKYDRMMVFNQFIGTDMVSTKYTAQQLKLIDSVKAGKKSLIAGVKEAYSSQLENIVTGDIIDTVGKLSVEGDNLTFVPKALAEEGAVNSVDELVDGLYNFMATGNSKVAGMLDNLANQYAPDAVDSAKRLLIYDALNTNLDDFSDAVKARVVDELAERQVGDTVLDVAQAKKISDDIVDNIKQNVKDRFDYYRVEVSRAAGDAKNLVNIDDWYGEVRDLAKEVGDTSVANNIVTARNANGEIEVYECDPLLATFMSNASATSRMSDGMLAKINYAWMKLFRFGTTGPNPVSWVNQFFRDFGNAWLVGGATKTITQATDILEEAFGANPAYYMSQFSEEFLEEAAAKAEQTGKTVERVLAESEIEYGGELVGSQTEHESLKAYRRLRDAKYIDGEIDTSRMSRIAEKADDAMDKLDGINKAREEWLRTRVYANNYAKAISEGKSISAARTWAQFYSSNATTNFTRATTFMAGLQNTIPYLRSAINGTKSFWRLWQVDPVGVTGRIIGGLVMPMVGMYTLTLNDPQNREVYKNIKEYQKANSLAFVVGGQAFFIPIPQEVATFITPIRQMVEGLYNVNTNSFAELAFSDILNLSPLDLSGFAGLDNYKIFEEGFPERLQAGFTKLAAQVLPKYANTLIALATNRDLYTGNKIDTSYTTIDPDTGEARVVDYTSGQFAKTLHNIFPGISAAMAQNILTNTIGQVGVGVGNWMVDMLKSFAGKQDWSETGTNVISGLAGAVTSPFTGYVMPDEAQTAWRQAVSEMYEYKTQIMNSEQYKAYVTEITKADSQEQIDKLATQRMNVVEPYYDKIKQMVTNYQNNYGVGLTQAQVASTISLMVMYQRTDYSGILSDEANDAAYAAARSQALQTMVNMGFPSSGNQDAIFGRIRTNSSGAVYVEYNNPIEILDFQKRYSLAPDVHTAQIKNLLDSAGLTVQEKNGGYYALKTKAEKKQYMKDWNAKVTKALAPYVQQYGVEAIFRNADISEQIDNYFYPGTYYSAKNYLLDVFGE